MSWQPYGIDDCARQVVLDALKRDPERKSMNQIFKMRLTCSYGLERFWGEYLRLRDGNSVEQNKAKIIKQTWLMLKNDILCDTGITLPYVPDVDLEDVDAVSSSLEAIWSLRTANPHQAQIVLAVLVNFCDAIIWWKNRLSPDPVQDNLE
jgi:hypothetical protein